MKADPTLAINAAKSFFGLAGTFFQNVPTDPQQHQQYLSHRLGGVISATTNLAFAIELYLKAVAILALGEAKSGHDLRKRFEDLPADVRSSIEDCYRFRISHDVHQRFLAIVVGYMKRDRPPTEDEKEAIAKLSHVGSGVVDLLEAHRDSFQAWRYLHEAADKNNLGCISVHWYRLGVLVNALQDQFIPPEKRPNFTTK
jgi:HEPN domain-containing protein